MLHGEDRAWEILKDLSPAKVCANARADFDQSSGTFILKSFGIDLSVNPAKRIISGSDPGADILLDRLGYFSRLATLCYLTGSMDIPVSGKLVQPAGLRGGQLFFRGSHVLPLDRLSAAYGSDIDAFVRKGEAFGGNRAGYGDAAMELFPFPRIPVLLILWSEDEEFPARADLLFDSSCEYHLALDVLWSTAMMSILIML